MNSIGDNPRVQQLLAEAEQALDLLQNERGAAVELRTALNSIYRDLGCYVHDLLRQDRSAQVEESMPLTVMSPVEDEDLSEEPSIESELINPRYIDGPDDLTDIPDAAALLWEVPELSEEDTEAAVGLSELEASVAALALPDDPEWAARLRSLLSLIPLPVDLTDPSCIAVEASKVQWASGAVGTRLSAYPVPIQQALLGMLVARAHGLMDHLEVEIGPRMAIERLRRMAKTHGIGLVVGMRANARPERNTWASDARGYWDLLQR